MATGLQQPLFCQDLLYPAGELRELIASLGTSAGVISDPSYKTSAGSGLQVNISSGAAFVEQANGPLYYQACTTTVTPSNSVVVSSVNPQIAQIILRIYDVNELKITGSSNAKIEWLNGTPTVLATEAKMQEGIYEGAASLPESSLRLSRILVPKNAASSASYYIEDTRQYSQGKIFPQMVSRSGNIVNARSGEFIQSTETINQIIKLPPGPTFGKIIGVYCTSESLEISSEVSIVGDFINSKTIKLLKYQHVILRGGAGGAGWYIIAGEPKLENSYSAEAVAVSGEEKTPSATRDAEVVLTLLIGSGAEIEVFCGGKRISFPTAPGSVGASIPISFRCPAGQKWKVVTHAGTLFQAAYSYLIL